MLRIICIFGVILLVHQELGEVDGVAVEENSGCFHNGTIFADGSLVPTLEPCLSCRCNGKTLVCSLRVCPEMPIPPPRGCVLVQNKNGCCPYLSCSKFHTLYNTLNRRLVTYLDHYERETIDRMVNENVLQRRSDDSDGEGSGEICVQNGTVYKSGSAMSSSSLCSYCYCIGGVQKCVKPKCMLAMSGCKPIFVDSTCCPVRYDCTTKSSGIVKSQNHIRKGDGNKHYQRMTQRLQRGRGCTTKSNFYPEGHKMPSDSDKPCDICFCIRGSRKCAPKRCAPALRNCIPVVPKGQCCPSSYDCGYVKDINRGDLSRQFDLFSLLFGADEAENATKPAPQKDDAVVKPTNEKSIFDAIREGLEFIDSNDSTVDDSLNETKVAGDNSMEIAQNTTTEKIVFDAQDDDDISLLDLLLGTAEPSSPSVEPEAQSSLKDDVQTTIDQTSEDDEDINLFDLIVGSDDHSSTTETADVSMKTTEISDFDYSNYSESDGSYEDYSGYGSTDESLRTATEEIDTDATISDDDDDHDDESSEEKFSTIGGTETTSSSEGISVDESTLDYDDSTSTVEPEVEESTLESATSIFVTTSAPRIVPTTTPFTTTTTPPPSTTARILPNTTTQAPTTTARTIPTTTTIKTTTTTPTSTIFVTSRTAPATAKTTTRIPTISSTLIKNTVKPTTQKSTTASTRRTTPSIATSTSTKPASIVTPVEHFVIPNESAVEIVTSAALKAITTDKPLVYNSSTATLTTTTTTTKPLATSELPLETLEEEPSEDFFSALFNGLSTIFTEDENATLFINKNNVTNNSPSIPQDSTTSSQNIIVTIEKQNLTKLEQTTSKEYYTQPPTENTIFTINNKIDSIPTEKASTNKKTEATNYVTPLPPTTVKTVIIKTNPSILEADYDLDYNEPTLPPSLPNLKIIPFLPADAVKSDRKQTVFDYYKMNPTSSYPSITESPSDTWGLNPITKTPNSKLDYDAYDTSDRYPSITEKHDPTTYPEKFIPYENHHQQKYGGYEDYEYSGFDVNDGNREKYHDGIKYIDSKYKGPVKKYDSVMTSYDNNGQYPGGMLPDVPGFSFDSNKVNGFSPPTKTEGGFLPKDPIKDEFIFDSFHTTKFMKELTTAAPRIAASNSTERLPAITTPDPFKDVIKTESPPDLHSLIEDKEKLLANGAPPNFYEPPVENSGFDKEIISITTDSSYNFTSEYKDANEIEEEMMQNHTKNTQKIGVNSNISRNSYEILNQINNKTRENVQNSLSNNKSNINNNKKGDALNLGSGLVDVASFFFSDEPKNETFVATTTSIPLFKGIPTRKMHLIENMKDKKENLSVNNATSEQLKNTTTTEKPGQDFNNILKDVLLSSFGLPDSEMYKPKSEKDRITTKATTTTTTTPNPFLSEPFNKLPFLNPSFPVRPHEIDYSPVSTDTNLGLSNMKSETYFHPGGYQILPSDSAMSNTESYVINPVDMDKLSQHQSEGAAQIFTKPDTSTSLKDPAGILKLAGCNIYGRMYRVGRIISELSGPCLECKCTEIGVNCTPLQC